MLSTKGVPKPQPNPSEMLTASQAKEKRNYEEFPGAADQQLKGRIIYKSLLHITGFASEHSNLTVQVHKHNSPSKKNFNPLNPLNIPSSAH